MRPLPAILCIDVEPDAFFVDRDRPVPWRGFEATAEFMAEFRPRLAALTDAPVHFAWFFRLDPQVGETYGAADWPLRRYATLVRGFEEAGDEIGIHTHPYHWDPGRRGWVQDHGNQPWIDHVVRSSFEAFRRALGRDCQSFRFGDRWMNDATIRLLESLGVRFDLTVEPGQPRIRSYHPEAPSTGSLPDYRRVPRTPYRPSPADFRKSDPSRRDGLILIPVSAGTIPRHRRRGRLGRAQRLLFRLFRLSRLRDRPFSLNLGHPPPCFTPIVDQVLDALRPPFLVLMVRTDAFADPAQRANLETNLAHIVTRSAVRRCRWSTPAELLALLGVP